MLASLRWWTRRLVRHDIQVPLVELILFRLIIVVVVVMAVGKLNISSDPMADLAPLWIVSARRVRIRHSNRELWDFVFAPDAWDSVD